MRYLFLQSAAVATLAAGITFAQAPASNLPSGTATTQEGPRDRMMEHLERTAQALNLTDSQKEQARMIFQQERQAAEPIRGQLKQNHDKLRAAAKGTGNTDEIQKISGEQGRLLGQLVAIHTEASAKFYRMLTPEQRIKADQMHEQMRQRMHSGERETGP